MGEEHMDDHEDCRVEAVPTSCSPFRTLKSPFHLDCLPSTQPELCSCDCELVCPKWSEVHGDAAQESSAESLMISTEPGLVSKRSTRRNQIRQLSEEKLQHFLKQHQFPDVAAPQRRCLVGAFSCLGLGVGKAAEEVLYPVHRAAELGCPALMRLLLRAGADPQQKTSHGRTAADMARSADRFGTHREVLDTLQGGLKVLALREAVSVMLADLSRLEDAGCAPEEMDLPPSALKVEGLGFGV
mmetsp:Transcript_64635/g.151912  ORF Transcript_64635/g.151912 Transcript_64635/m.151912 type:complete len:242 (+) Transcript_64635:88-813(+)